MATFNIQMKKFNGSTWDSINPLSLAKNISTTSGKNMQQVVDTTYNKTEVDNLINTLNSGLDWKESVETFDDIATVYATPQDGWTVNVKDTDITYRYTGTEWIAVSANSIPMATSSVDGKMSKEDKAKLDATTVRFESIDRQLASKLNTSGGTLAGALTVETEGIQLNNGYLSIGTFNDTQYGTGLAKLYYANADDAQEIRMMGVKNIKTATGTVYHTGNKPTPSELGVIAKTDYIVGTDGLLPSITGNDIHSISKSGRYCGRGVINGPNTDWWYFDVEAHTANYIKVTAKEFHGSRRIFTKTKVDGVWSPWEAVYTATNKPTLADIGAAASGHNHDTSYLKLSGGTMTGDLILGTTCIRGVRNTPIFRDFSNGNVVLSASHKEDGTAGTLYLGYNSGDFKTNAIVLGAKVLSTGNQTVVDTDGKIPWSILKGMPTIIDPNHNHDSAYLKLSGGTITGVTNINNTLHVNGNQNINGLATVQVADATPLRVKRVNSDSNISIQLSGQTINRFIGIANNGELKFGNSADLAGTGHTVYHSGNKPNSIETMTASRPTTANVPIKGDRSQKLILSTNTMTEGKPSGDGFIQHFEWDSAAGWSSQMFIRNDNNPIIQMRGMNNKTWGNWHTVYSTNNKPTPADISAIGFDYAGNAQYARFVPPKSDWIRTGKEGGGGILPYRDNDCMIGTSSWRFKEIHAMNLFEGGTSLSNKYAAKAHDHNRILTRDEVGGFDKTVASFKRPNATQETYGGLNIHVTHPSYSGGEYSRGIAFEYGTGLKINTYGFGADGKQFQNAKIYTSADKPTAADVGARPSNWVPSWNDISGKPSTFAPVIGSASNQAAAGNHGHNHLTTNNITDWNSHVASGFYQGNGATNAPEGGWIWGFRMQHGGGYGAQIGITNGTGKMYFRSQDTAGAGSWYRVYHTGNKPTLSELGAAASNHTHAYVPTSDVANTATANKVAKLDANADLNCRLVRSNYANQTSMSGAIAFRVNNSNDNFVRFCSDAGAVRSWIGASANNHNHDSAYLKLAGGTMTGNLTTKYITCTGITATGDIVASHTGGYVSGVNITRAGGAGHGKVRLYHYSSTDGPLAIESFNSDGTYGGVAMLIVGATIRPTTHAKGSVGHSSFRFVDVYATRGAFNGSDIALKENIKPVLRQAKGLKLANEVTSIDLYNYVKNTGTYTFNYKNTKENFIGIIANEVPDNVFSKIGVMSCTEEEYQERLNKKAEAQEILSKTPIELTEETRDKIVPGSEKTLHELTNEANEEIEGPTRLINGPAQIAMLQEVLSMALNKIEMLEKEVAALKGI